MQCCCNDSQVDPPSAGRVQQAQNALCRLFGVVFTLFCFGGHDKVPPATRAWLRRLPPKKRVVAIAGGSRKGKSFLIGEFVDSVLLPDPNATAAAHREGLLQLPVGRFATSAAPRPCTLGIQVMALPVFRGGELVPDECWLVVDAEGLDLGDPANHRAILGTVSRLATSLTYVETSEYNDNVVAHMGRLMGTNALVVNNPAAVHSALPLPNLIVLLNKYGLEPFASAEAATAFLRDQLELKGLNTTYQPERALLQAHWMSRDRLDLLTVPFDAALIEEPRGVLRPATATAIAEWTKTVKERTPVFPLPFSDDGLADYCDALLQDCRQAADGKDQGVSVLQAMVGGETGRLLNKEKAEYRRLVEDAKLVPGAADVDGARGAASEEAAKAVRAELVARHSAIARTCKDHLDAATRSFRDRCCDHVIEAALEDLSALMAANEARLLEHFGQQRSVDPSKARVESKTVDSNYRTEVSYGRRKYGIAGPHKRHCTNYVDRSTLSRTVNTRFNGDIVATEWAVGSVVKVSI